MSQTMTIIDDKGIRGVVAPAASFSRELLEDVIDLIELSTAREVQKTATRLKSGDRAKSWVSLSDIRPK